MSWWPRAKSWRAEVEEMERARERFPMDLGPDAGAEDEAPGSGVGERKPWSFSRQKDSVEGREGWRSQAM